MPEAKVIPTITEVTKNADTMALGVDIRYLDENLSVTAFIADDAVSVNGTPFVEGELGFTSWDGETSAFIDANGNLIISALDADQYAMGVADADGQLTYTY